MELKTLGEFNFIHSIESDTIYDNKTVVQGIGDDCAIYKASEGYDQLISTDTMVEGVHFSFHYMAPYDVGYRLMTANLSDIAAMEVYHVRLYYLYLHQVILTREF